MPLSLSTVKVIGTRFSAFIHRAEVALRLKGVPYELITEDLNNKSELLLKHNPVHKKVPILLHGDRSIPESLIIIEYVDEQCFRLVWLALWTDGGAREGFEKEAKEGLAPNRHCLALLEGQLEGKRFFSGDCIGYVDIATSVLTYWLAAMDEFAGVKLMNAEEYPSLCRWAREYTSSEAVKGCLPDWDQLVTAYAANKEKFVIVAKTLI
uniref:glutathione transferase n=1 Tax=Leersia perrieri TaxID=77586 RepID=A0A0D9VA88_9ORYZ